MDYNKDYLHNMYNGTSTTDETGELETYEHWLERQLISRLNELDKFIAIETESGSICQFTVKGELLFELESKRQWINRVPQILPEKRRTGEQWVWVDKNGNHFECGGDFSAAEKISSYPCRVYRLQSVADANDC